MPEATAFFYFLFEKCGLTPERLKKLCPPKEQKHPLILSAHFVSVPGKERGNQIIISGRRKSHLEATTKANPGMVSMSWILKTRRASPRWQRSSLPSIRKLA